MFEEPTETHRRTWALESACNLARKGTKPEKVLDAARKYYGFISGNEGNVEKLKGVEKP